MFYTNHAKHFDTLFELVSSCGKLSSWYNARLVCYMGPAMRKGTPMTPAAFLKLFMTSFKFKSNDYITNFKISWIFFKNSFSYRNRKDTAIISTFTMKINFENFDLMALFAWRVTYCVLFANIKDTTVYYIIHEGHQLQLLIHSYQQ